MRTFRLTERAKQDLRSIGRYTQATWGREQRDSYLSCNPTHDRDENAAKNINIVGIEYCHDSKRAQRQSKSTSVASVSEASRILTPSG